MSILGMGSRILREIWAKWAMPYYIVSHWSVAIDGSGEIGPQNVGIIHVIQWDCHLGW